MTSTADRRRTLRLPHWAVEALPAPIRAEVAVLEPLLRAPEQVLSPEALHTMTSTRLSFANTLVEKMAHERWQIALHTVDIAADGSGFLSFEIDAAGRVMTFAVEANPPMPVDKVTLFRDDATDYFAALLDGPFDRDLWEHERHQFNTAVWRGRSGDRVFGWTVARISRAFEPTVQALVEGRQPDREAILRSGGRLVRNGGYYGNGRMGTLAWKGYSGTGRPFESPYHVDLFALYMWRLVGFAVCEATARARSESAATLRPEVKRYIGVGNSSGLGTIAALVRFPERLSSFILPREIALAYVLSRTAPLQDDAVATVKRLLLRAADAYSHATPAEFAEPRQIVADTLLEISRRIDQLAADPDGFGERPWNRLVQDCQELASREAVDLLRSFVIEAYPETAGLSALPAVSASQSRDIAPEMTLGTLREAIETEYNWALQIDFSEERARHFFWYRSEENGENRRGERSVDVGVERETFIDVAGSIRRLYDFALSLSPEMTVGEFLLSDPEHTLAVRRLQVAIGNPYSEFRADICASDFLASDGIRTFLAILGLEMADPYSRRYVRGVFFRGAPLPEDFARGVERDWRFPSYDEALAAGSDGDC